MKGDSQATGRAPRRLSGMAPATCRAANLALKGVWAGVQREMRWRDLFIAAATPEKAADEAETVAYNARTHSGGRSGDPLSFAYSWVPGMGLNLIPRKETPMGAVVEASMVMAVQMTLIEVAAIAVVPWITAPVPNETLEYALLICVPTVMV